LGIVANQRDALGGEFKFLTSEVAEVANREPAQTHGPEVGRVPECM
jgi:hypothetical protein